MKPPIAFTTLFSFFTSTTPDLCDEVYMDAAGSPYSDSQGRTLARYCEWTGPDAPVLDEDVCCVVDEDGAACTLPAQSGRCRLGLRMHCDHGVVAASGGVVCQQPFPSMCDAGFCVEAPEVMPPPQAFLGCCSAGGACQYVPVNQERECQGEYVYCLYGTQNEDGTVECY